MLKALELCGFKSFADRTRFEFPAGVSVVVGPNGSGKSNIVDAVKWVLGSQSAKSLRGKEMTDVIFNGCASRGPSGTSEVTLTLDNPDGRLPIDAKEVHLTRRVYRSGEGEYLINRQPCRLRDMRELLAGTGITTEAYCIIEQGKVDALLQSSPRDRRVIFEEAAGISQFKLKKAAAARRMERVEQNLLRLSDIVDEVESRLRSLRTQAAKARRYRECTERLQQLRTEVGLFDWRALTSQLTARDEQLAGSRRRRAECQSVLDDAEKNLRELEARSETLLQKLRQIEAAASATREQAAKCEATLESQTERRRELEHEIAHLHEQLATATERAGGEAAPDVVAQLEGAEADLARAAEECRESIAALHQSQAELSAARSSSEDTRLRLSEARRSASMIADQITAAQSQLDATAEQPQTLAREREELQALREAAERDLASCERAEAEWASQAATHQEALATADQRLVHVRRELARADKQHRQLESRLTRTRERIAVLTELESRLEGLAGGVQEALRLAQAAADGPLGEIRGMVADLFHVDVDSAPLVEMALGERASFFVLASGGRLLELLQNEPLGIGGRVGFLSLDARLPQTALDQVDLSREGGVMGRADRFVESAPEIEPLVRRLLGRTWLVDRLATAVRLSQTTGRGLDFVTSDGELLLADGSLIIGPRQAAAGVMSRRSELRASQEQVVELERQLDDQTAIHNRLDHERAAQEQVVASSVSAYSVAAGRLGECREQTGRCRAELGRTIAELERTQTHLRATEERLALLRTEIAANRTRLEELDSSAREMSAELADREQAVTRLEQQHAAMEAAATGRQIAAAKCEQRVEMLRLQREQAEHSIQERERALAELRQRIASRETQALELDAVLVSTRQTLAESLEQKRQHVEELAGQAAAQESMRLERGRLAERVRAERDQLAAVQAQEHKLEVLIARLRHERQILCERMQDDYGIDLAEAAQAERGEAASAAAVSTHDSGRDAIEREITELRNQINNVGAINLEALDELDQLESRFEALSTQYRDLVDAKAALERVVQRINIDSRQLFVATLEAVRGHFQDLFRRLFGGGEADIVVDEADDILECGIEIVARPPGKEACSISLLSGGEKTLTCVALLLAVFRSKPSPFCVLDEVDAALDEANIGRFVGVLREFMSFTQFIVVTHSKRTMAGADTLYGVTMEESGVSKRVSVRFEDVSENGEIAPSALRRAA